MKNSSKPNEATFYKIKFTKLIIILAIAVLVFCTAGIGFCVYQIILHGIIDFYDVMKYPFLLLVSSFCISLVIAILIKSQYVIDKTYLTSQFGFIKSKYEIKNISSVLLDMNTNKLTVQCNEEFFVISLQKDWNEAFIHDLLKVNPNIDYSFTFSDENKNH